jgi:hypothetical protein
VSPEDDRPRLHEVTDLGVAALDLRAEDPRSLAEIRGTAIRLEIQRQRELRELAARECVQEPAEVAAKAIDHACERGIGIELAARGGVAELGLCEAMQTQRREPPHGIRR